MICDLWLLIQFEKALDPGLFFNAYGYQLYDTELFIYLTSGKIYWAITIIV